MKSGRRPIDLGYGFITGTSYCGSTLTSILLGWHPEIFSPGEMGPSSEFATEDYLCSCGVPLVTCEFYGEVASRLHEDGVDFDPLHWNLRYRLASGRMYERLLHGKLSPLVVELARDRAIGLLSSVRKQRKGFEDRLVKFARVALECSRRRIFVDATKHPRRILDLYRIFGECLRIIHLVRDPRGFCNSMRKNEGASIERAAKTWNEINGDVLRYCSHLPSTNCRLFRYEDLCSAPDRLLAEMASFLGARESKVPSTLDPRTHHTIGNRMRLRPLNLEEIATDETWRAELSLEHTRRIEDATRGLARSLGYEF